MAQSRLDQALFRAVRAGWGVSDPIGAPKVQDLPLFHRAGSHQFRGQAFAKAVQVSSLGHKGLPCAQRSPAERERPGLLGIIP